MCAACRGCRPCSVVAISPPIPYIQARHDDREKLMFTFCARASFPSRMRLRVICSTTGSYLFLKFAAFPSGRRSGIGNLWPTPAPGYSRPTILVSWKRTRSSDESGGGGPPAEVDDGELVSGLDLRVEVEKDLEPEGVFVDLESSSCFNTFGAFSWASGSRCKICSHFRQKKSASASLRVANPARFEDCRMGSPLVPASLARYPAVSLPSLCQLQPPPQKHAAIGFRLLRSAVAVLF